MSYAPMVVVWFGIASSLRGAIPGLPFRKVTPPPPPPHHDVIRAGLGSESLPLHFWLRLSSLGDP